MKCYRKWLLVLLLAWLLLFLFLLRHILNRGSSCQYWPAADSGLTPADTHCLALGLPRRGVGLSTKMGRRSDYRARSRHYYRSWSLEILQRLWAGNLTVRMLSPHLQKVLKVQLSSNKHQVVHQRLRQRQTSGLQLYCEMKRRIRIRTVDGTEEPFSNLGWAQLVPSVPLQELRTSPYQRCAVVMSAGAVLNSVLGREIDSHDAVLRFNAAPTRGFERDVGTRTTIRIINSQIMAQLKHEFSSSALYQNVTLLAWDPAPYSSNLSQWFLKPDFDVFTPYVDRRRIRPEQPFYILHPEFIWSLWDLIQDNSEDAIQPNPPSSGFTGIAVMMSLCQEVSVYEFLPSLRRSDLCHYYERYRDAACTLGAYHPLLYEKLLVQRMNTGRRDQLVTKGKVTLRGFSSLDCPS